MQRPLLGKNPLGEATVMPCPRKPRIHRGGGVRVPTSVDSLLDDNSYLSPEHGAKELHNHDQAAAEDQQGD